jgi:hypothetical protein
MQYHSEGKITTVYTNQIVKIIDYGRSYYFDTPQNNSLTIYNKVCNSEICTDDTRYCGDEKGYYWLNKNNDHNYIHSKVSNQSHDLRLLSMIYEKYGEYITWAPLRAFMSDIVYLYTYGTPQDMDMNNIRNIHSANKWIVAQIESPEFQQLNKEIYKDKRVIGTLKVWLNRSRPMEWIITT